MREGQREGRREAKFVRTCPGSEPRSLRVAAGSCGGSLPLSPLPPSWRNWGRGGDVSAPPCPSPAAWKGFSGGDRLRDSSGGELGGCRGSPAAAAVPPVSLSNLPRLRAPQTAGVPRTQHRAALGPALRASLGLPTSPLRQRFPRLELQVMLFLFCSWNSSLRVACRVFAGRKHEQPLQTGLEHLYFVALQLLEVIYFKYFLCSGALL